MWQYLAIHEDGANIFRKAVPSIGDSIKVSRSILDVTRRLAKPSVAFYKVLGLFPSVFIRFENEKMGLFADLPAIEGVRGWSQNCIVHCMDMAAKGETELAKCDRPILQMLSLCTALQQPANPNSSLVRETAIVAIEACNDCADVCEKFGRQVPVCTGSHRAFSKASKSLRS